MDNAGMTSRAKPVRRPNHTRKRVGPTFRSGATSIEPVIIARGEEIERVIFKGSRKPLDRRELHVTLEPILRAWIRAACTWDMPAIGDYRFVVFEIEVSPETLVYVQFWSEPMEPVLWEVSSGRWNPPADEWLAGERAQRIEALGFTIGGQAENYHREIEVATAADIATVAKEVVKIFYAGFDYRGAQPIVAKLVWEGRSESNETYDAFTPDDVGKVFAGLGYRVREPLVNEAEEEPLPMLDCRKRGISTIVQFGDQVGDENLYARVRLQADVDLPEEERQRLKMAPDAPENGEPVLTVSVVHPFSGGVTLQWLIERIREWDAMLAEHRRAARRGRRRAASAPATQTVH